MLSNKVFRETLRISREVSDFLGPNRCLQNKLLIFHFKELLLKSILMLSLMLLSSCAGIKDQYPENVSIQKTITTKRTKSANHGKAFQWMIMNLSNTSETIKLNDQANGRLVLNDLTDCTISNGPGYVSVKFVLNLTVTSADNKVIFSAPNVVSNDNWNYPRNDDQMKEVRACIEETILKPLSLALIK